MEKSPRVDGLLRQINNLQGQLTAMQSRSSSLESELAQRDRQLLRKCDELKQVEMQVSWLMNGSDTWNVHFVWFQNHCWWSITSYDG